MDQDLSQSKRQKTEFILNSVYNLPANSLIMKEVSQMLDSPSINSKTLGGMIGKDQAIATKILSIANSPMYGLSRKVSTIDFAVLIIGLREVKNIVFAISIMEAFKNKTDQYLDQKQYWFHSVITANASKKIAEDIGYEKSGEAFVAGLLHDLGVPVMHKYFHSSFVKIYGETAEQQTGALESETEQLGMTHMDIGRSLCEKWNLPLLHCDVIGNHHRPGLAREDKTLASIVHLADYMTQVFNIGGCNMDRNIKMDDSVIDILNFKDQQSLTDFIENYRDLYGQDIKAVL